MSPKKSCCSELLVLTWSCTAAVWARGFCTLPRLHSNGFKLLGAESNNASKRKAAHAAFSDPAEHSIIRTQLHKSLVTASTGRGKLIAECLKSNNNQKRAIDTD